MNFNIREIKDTDFPEIARWFEKRKWPMPPAPGAGAKIGVISEREGQAVACMYSYLTGTSVVYLEWPALNPDVDTKVSMAGFSEIITHFKKMAELSSPKIHVLAIYTASKALASEFKKHGFKLDEGYTKATWMLRDI